MHLIFEVELSETQLIIPSETQTDFFSERKTLPGTVYPHWKISKHHFFADFYLCLCWAHSGANPLWSIAELHDPKALGNAPFPKFLTLHLVPARELRLEEPFEAFPADGNSSSVRGWEKRIWPKDPRSTLDKFAFTGAPKKHLQGSDLYFKAKQEVLLHRN